MTQFDSLFQELYQLITSAIEGFRIILRDEAKLFELSKTISDISDLNRLALCSFEYKLGLSWLQIKLLEISRLCLEIIKIENELTKSQKYIFSWKELDLEIRKISIILPLVGTECLTKTQQDLMELKDIIEILDEHYEDCLR